MNVDLSAEKKLRVRAIKLHIVKHQSIMSFQDLSLGRRRSCRRLAKPIHLPAKVPLIHILGFANPSERRSHRCVAKAWRNHESLSRNQYYKSMCRQEVVSQFDLFLCAEQKRRIKYEINWETRWHFLSREKKTYAMRERGHLMEVALNMFVSRYKFIAVFSLAPGEPSIAVEAATVGLSGPSPSGDQYMFVEINGLNFKGDFSQFSVDLWLLDTKSGKTALFSSHKSLLTFFRGFDPDSLEVVHDHWDNRLSQLNPFNYAFDDYSRSNDWPLDDDLDTFPWEGISTHSRTRNCLFMGLKEARFRFETPTAPNYSSVQKGMEEMAKFLLIADLEEKWFNEQNDCLQQIRLVFALYESPRYIRHNCCRHAFVFQNLMASMHFMMWV